MMTESVLFAGECKFKNTPFDKTDLDNFMDKIKYLPVTDPVICLFSLNGFTDDVKKSAKNCRLISIEDMY